MGVKPAETIKVYTNAYAALKSKASNMTRPQAWRDINVLENIKGRYLV